MLNHPIATALVNCLSLAVGAAGVRWSEPEYRWIFEWIVYLSVGAAVLLSLYALWPRIKGRFRMIEPSHVIIFGLCIALGGVVWQMRRSDPQMGVVVTSPASQTPPQATLSSEPPVVALKSVETYLRVKFKGGNQSPEAEGLANIWRWYALMTGVRFVQAQTGERHEVKTWAIFVTFHEPVKLKQIIVTGTPILPDYEVKDRDPRSVVVSFMSDIPETTIEIRATSY